MVGGFDSGKVGLPLSLVSRAYAHTLFNTAAARAALS